MYILVIACKPKDLPYLEALLPNDTDLETLDEESFQQKAKEKVKTQTKDGGNTADTIGNDTSIDNPYLREIKMPKIKGGKNSKYSYLY